MPRETEKLARLLNKLPEEIGDEDLEAIVAAFSELPKDRATPRSLFIFEQEFRRRRREAKRGL